MYVHVLLCCIGASSLVVLILAAGTHKLFPVYSLYLKEGDVFLMASKKKPKNKTSNYLISSGSYPRLLTTLSLCLIRIYVCLCCMADQNNLNKGGASYLGKLRSNFVGTEFQVGLLSIHYYSAMHLMCCVQCGLCNADIRRWREPQGRRSG